MSFSENRAIDNARKYNTGRQIENNTTNYFSQITGISRDRVKKAMKDNPLLAAALSGVGKAKQEQLDNTGVGVAYKYIQKSMDEGTEAADLKDSTNVADVSLQGYDPVTRLASLGNPSANAANTYGAAARDVPRLMNGGLMSMSPQARMNQGLMQFYQPPQRMANGGAASFDPVRLLLQGMKPETPEFMEELIRLTKENLRAKGTLNQRILDKPFDLGAIEPVAKAKEGFQNVLDNIPRLEQDQIGEMSDYLSTLASTAKDKIQGNVEEEGTYDFLGGTDREQVMKAAGNLRESIAKQQERESNPDEVLTGFGRFMENVGDFTGITGESTRINIGDLREELEEYYTDSFYEDAPRQTAARKEDRQKIRAMVKNATPDQLLALSDEIKAGRGNIDAQGVSGILGVELKEDSEEQVDSDKGKDKKVIEKSDVVIEDMEGTTSDTLPTPGRRAIEPKSDLDQNIAAISEAGEGNAVDLADRLKSAKDPKRFIDTLTSKELLTMAAAYLGTTSVTEGTKAALTSLLKSREADRAHDLAVMRADSLDKYYQGLLESQKRGQDLTYRAALMKQFQENNINRNSKEFVAAKAKVRAELNERLASKNIQSMMEALKTVDKSIYNYFKNNNIEPDTETIIEAITATDFGLKPFFNLAPSVPNDLVRSVTKRT